MLRQSRQLTITAILLGLLTTGCDDGADTDASATSDTNEGVPYTNSSGETLLTEVDYSQPVDEENIGIPTDTSSVIRKTVVEISFKTDILMLLANDADVPDTAVTSFKPTDHKNFAISHSNLVVVDSKGDQHPLVFYIKPYEYDSSKISFTVFATLDNIAYNTLSFNQSHTAFYLRGAYWDGNEQSSDYLWGKSHLVSSTDEGNLPSKWIAGLIQISRVDGTSLAPTVTKYPCYKKYSGVECDNYDSKTGTTNILRDSMLFQPIATVGYQDFNFFEYAFTHDTLKNLSPSSLVTTADQATYHALAVAETLDKLKEDYNHNKIDIGWYGLPINTRNSIIRYHTTEVKFTWTDDISLGNETMVVNSIKLANFTVGSSQPTEPTEILSDGNLTITLQNATVSE